MEILERGMGVFKTYPSLSTSVSRRRVVGVGFPDVPFGLVSVECPRRCRGAR